MAPEVELTFKDVADDLPRFIDEVAARRAMNGGC
jgi:hypothetical protein